MKIIELLNKMANGEEVPKKIKWGEFELEYEELGYHDYKFLDTGNHLLFQGFATSVLNDEVEIIEEDKKIEKLQYSKLEVCPDLESLLEYVNESREEFRQKINEIIDKINEMESATRYLLDEKAKEVVKEFETLLKGEK